MVGFRYAEGAFHGDTRLKAQINGSALPTGTGKIYHAFDLATTGRLPGYVGHIPGFRNTFGCTYSSASITEKTDQHEVYSACKQHHAKGMPSERAVIQSDGRGQIPNYLGYIPGLRARNVIGNTFKRVTQECAETVKQPYMEVIRTQPGETLKEQRESDQKYAAFTAAAQASCRRASPLVTPLHSRPVTGSVPASPAARSRPGSVIEKV
jgi:hypothetical protein